MHRLKYRAQGVKGLQVSHTGFRHMHGPLCGPGANSAALTYAFEASAWQRLHPGQTDRQTDRQRPELADRQRDRFLLFTIYISKIEGYIFTGLEGVAFMEQMACKHHSANRDPTGVQQGSNRGPTGIQQGFNMP